jgi:hypothetical protein
MNPRKALYTAFPPRGWERGCKPIQEIMNAPEKYGSQLKNDVLTAFCFFTPWSIFDHHSKINCYL